MNINLDYKDIPLTEIEKIYDLKFKENNIIAYTIFEDSINDYLDDRIKSLYPMYNKYSDDIYLIIDKDIYAIERHWIRAIKYVICLKQDIFNELKPSFDKLKKLQAFI